MKVLIFVALFAFVAVQLSQAVPVPEDEKKEDHVPTSSGVPPAAASVAAESAAPAAASEAPSSSAAPAAAAAAPASPAAEEKKPAA